MRANFFLFLQCAALLSAATTSGPATCNTATLNVYQGLGAVGCTLEDFTFKNFDFQTLSALNGAVPVGAGNILVTPSAIGSNLSVKFSSTGFSVRGPEFVQYLIAYTIDPLPPVIIRFDDSLDAESPVAPGTADVNTNLCLGSLFNSFSVCGESGTFASLSVFHHGTPTGNKLFDEVNFPGVNLVDVRNTITLAANGSTSQITGFGNIAGIPEPGAWALAGSGLALLLLRRVGAKVT